MNSGLMDVLVAVQVATFSNSSYGVATKAASWATDKQIWGRVQYNGGGETKAAEKVEFRETATVTLHYTDSNSITVENRLYFDSRPWNIRSKSYVGRNQYIRLEVENVQ
jgi:head-tail adaptor